MLIHPLDFDRFWKNSFKSLLKPIAPIDIETGKTHN